MLTTLSVLIGVAFTVGVFVTTDGLRSTFGDLSEDIFRGVDLQVRPEIEFGDRDFNAPLLDPSLVEVARSVDGVAAAEGGVFEFNVVAIDPEGEALTSNGPPQMGVGWPDDDLLSQVSIWPDNGGRRPQGPGEFAMDAGTAGDNGFEIGERYRISTPSGSKEFELVGLFRFGTGDEATVGAQIVAWDVDTAIDLLHNGGGIDSIDVRVEPGASLDQVRAALAQAMPAGNEVIAYEQLVEEQTDEFNDVIGFFRNFLLAFAIVILVVSAFIIYNTFTILVGQRIRELGLLRALGASGNQITTMVIVEAIVVGLVATGLGLGLGVLIALGIKGLFSSFGADLPDTPIIIAGTTVAFAFLVGVGVSAASATWPALRARKVSPMAALSADVRLGLSDARRAPTLGALLYGLGLAVVVAGIIVQSTWIIVLAALVGAILLYVGGTRIHLIAGRISVLALGIALLLVAILADFSTGDILVLLGMGALLVFVGMNLVSPIFAQPAVRFLGRVTPLLMVLGLPIMLLVGLVALAMGRGRQWWGWVRDLFRGIGWGMARRNSARSPRRTANTASALMIGLALICMVTVLAQSFKQTLADILEDAVDSDWLICVGNCNEFTASINPEVAQAMSELDELESAISWRLREDLARLPATGEVLDIGSTDLDELVRHIDPDIVAGSTEGAGAGHIIMHDEKADELGLAVGDSVELEFAGGQLVEFEVVALYANEAVLSGWGMDNADWDRYVTGTQDQFISAVTAEGFTEAQARAAIEAAVVNYPQLEIRNQTEFRESQESQVDQFLAIVNVFLGIALAIALIGITNTLALSVFERTRELGLLRAVGMSRLQTRRMIRWEGAIVAAFGGLMGAVIGVLFAWAAVLVIPDSFISAFAVPWDTLIIYLFVAALAGILAAYMPARRASNLNILEAISYE